MAEQITYDTKLNLQQILEGLKEKFSDLNWFVLITPHSVIVASKKGYVVKRVVDEAGVLDFTNMDDVHLSELSLEPQKQTPIITVVPIVFTNPEDVHDLHCLALFLLSPYYWGESNRPFMPKEGFNLYSKSIVSKPLCELEEGEATIL